MDERDPYDDFSSDYPRPDRPGQADPPGPDDLTPPPPPPPVASGSGYRAHTCPSCGSELTGTPIGGRCPSCGASVGPGTGTGYPRQNGKAITAMVLGICSIPICFCYGVPSIIAGIIGAIFGHLASKEIAQGGYSESSRGMATAGKICSWIGILLGVGYIVFMIVMLAFIASNTPQPSQPGGPYPYTPGPGSPSSPTYYQAPGGGSSWNGRSGTQWNSGANRIAIERGPDAYRPKLPNNLEYAPNGLEYGPGGNLQPALPSPGPVFGPGPAYP